MNDTKDIPDIWNSGALAEDITAWAYECLILSTRFLHAASPATIETILTIVRPSLGLSARMHSKLVRELCLYDSDVALVSTSPQVAQAMQEMKLLSKNKGSSALPNYFVSAAKDPIAYLELLDAEHQQRNLPRPHARLVEFLRQHGSADADAEPSSSAALHVRAVVQMQLYARILQRCCFFFFVVGGGGGNDDAAAAAAAASSDRHIPNMEAVAEALEGLRLNGSDGDHIVAFIFALLTSLRFQWHVISDSAEATTTAAAASIPVAGLEDRLIRSLTLVQEHKLAHPLLAGVLRMTEQLCAVLLSNYRFYMSDDPSQLKKYLDIFSLSCPRGVEPRVRAMVKESMSHVVASTVAMLEAEDEEKAAERQQQLQQQFEDGNGDAEDGKIHSLGSLLNSPAAAATAADNEQHVDDEENAVLSRLRSQKLADGGGPSAGQLLQALPSSFGPPDDPTRGLSIQNLLQRVEDEMEVEENTIAPYFDGLVPSSRFASQCLFQELVSFLQDTDKGRRLERTVYDISKMWQLQHRLLFQSGGGGGGGSGSGSGSFQVKLYEPVIVTFVQQLQGRLAEVLYGSLQFDSFDVRELDAPRKPTSSLVDLFTAIHQNRPPPLPISYRKMYWRVVCGVVQLYLSELCRMYNRETAERCMPEAPPLAKFKHRADKKKGWPQPIRSFFDTAAVSIDSLLLRLNDVQFCMDHFMQLLKKEEEELSRLAKEEEEAAAAAAEGERKTGALSSGTLRQDSIPTIEFIRDQQLQLMEYIGLRIAFGDLKQDLLDRLYVAELGPGATMSAVLRKFDPMMARICDVLLDRLVDPLVQQILRSVVRCIRFVLLNGGIQRIFDPVSAVPQLMKDVLQLETFFIADGQGLPKETVLAETKPLRDLVAEFFTKDSAVLVQIAAGAAVSGTGARAYSEQDRSVAFRILAKRPSSDLVAARYVDEQLHLLKKQNKAR